MNIHTENLPFIVKSSTVKSLFNTFSNKKQFVTTYGLMSLTVI